MKIEKGTGALSAKSAEQPKQPVLDATLADQLADFLFATRFATGHEEPFRYLAVVPSAKDGQTEIHFAIAEPSWERAGYSGHCLSHAHALLQDRLDQAIAELSIDRNVQFSLTDHQYLHRGWPIDWKITKKRGHNNFPMLIAIEREDGSIEGVVMRNAHCRNITLQLASEHAELDEAWSVIAGLRALTEFQQCPKYLGLFKDRNIDGDSLDAVIQTIPLSPGGQAEMLLFRNHQWCSGIWNQKPPYADWTLHLTSVSEFYGIRASKKASELRPELDVALREAVVAGDYAVLLESCAMASEGEGRWQDSYEHPAIRHLCAWWNTNAPEGMRKAASCRIYWWDAENRIMQSGDPEEPCETADVFETIPCKASFIEPGMPSVVVIFLARQEPTEEGGTRVNLANGIEYCDVGGSEADYNEAYYGVVGLRRFWDCHCPF